MQRRRAPSECAGLWRLWGRLSSACVLAHHLTSACCCQRCYDIVAVPETVWLCDVCTSACPTTSLVLPSESDMRRAAQVPCCVCGVHGGALRLHDGAFVHPHCQCVKELQATVRYW